MLAPLWTQGLQPDPCPCAPSAQHQLGPAQPPAHVQVEEVWMVRCNLAGIITLLKAPSSTPCPSLVFHPLPLTCILPPAPHSYTPPALHPLHFLSPCPLLCPLLRPLLPSSPPPHLSECDREAARWCGAHVHHACTQIPTGLLADRGGCRGHTAGPHLEAGG